MCTMVAVFIALYSICHYWTSHVSRARRSGSALYVIGSKFMPHYKQNIRGVQNPMKMSDIGFLKTKRNRTDLKIHNQKLSFEFLREFSALEVIF